MNNRGHSWQKKNWTILIPIHNLEISSDFSFEFQVEQVLFVSAEKIPRIRKRLGLPKTVSEYKKKMQKSGLDLEFFDAASTYAVVRSSREEDAPLNREFDQLRDAIHLLASSQLRQVKRQNRVIFGSPDLGVGTRYPMFCNQDSSFKISSFFSGNLSPYRIDNEWKRIIRNHHFYYLKRILDNKVAVSGKWKGQLRRAAILIGRSVFASTMWEAFLYNMIALEVLLSNKGDKFPDKLIERVVCLFGWLTDEDPKPWEDVISRLYQLRCDFVHDGAHGDLGGSDLIYSDLILENLLRNLCSMTKDFGSKQDIITFADQVAARKVLGLKIKRPKGLHFISSRIYPRDIEAIEKPEYWYGR